MVPVAVLLETTTVSRCWDGSGPSLVRIMVVCVGLATSKVDNPSLALNRPATWSEGARTQGKAAAWGTACAMSTSWRSCADPGPTGGGADVDDVRDGPGIAVEGLRVDRQGVPVHPRDQQSADQQQSTGGDEAADTPPLNAHRPPPRREATEPGEQITPVTAQHRAVLGWDRHSSAGGEGLRDLLGRNCRSARR